MKKILIPVVALALIGIGVFAFTKKGEAPASPEPQASEGRGGAEEQPIDVVLPSFPATDAPAAPAAPSSGSLGVKQYVDNSAWKIRLEFDPSWDLNQQGATIIMSAEHATFYASEDKPIGEPQQVKMTTVKRTVAGKTVTARRYEPSVEGYAYYEFFELPLGNDTYYFKISAKVENDPDVDAFIAGITIK